VLTLAGEGAPGLVSAATGVHAEPKLRRTPA